MNILLHNLAEQCRTFHRNGHGGYDESFDEEKFAELIVKECMTTMRLESKWYWDKDEFESSNAIQNAVRRVKEHFGIEE